ncbi:MAG: hypothetical protein SFV81_30705 [Pirellulaceae bacterium]|nr:hypothetical protein [Pirellulaceae bacterium]
MCDYRSQQLRPANMTELLSQVDDTKELKIANNTTRRWTYLETSLDFSVAVHSTSKHKHKRSDCSEESIDLSENESPWRD